MRLAGKVAVITGAGRGIGRAAAELFAAEGAVVGIFDCDVLAGDRAARDIAAAGGCAHFIPVDVSRATDVRRGFATIAANHGRLDVLYNNAGVHLGPSDGAVDECSNEVWDKVLAVNLTGVFYCCKFAMPLLIDRGGGSVILTSSSAATIGIPGSDAYTASKGAVLALTRSMAVEYGPRGVRVNCIIPAAVDTAMLRASASRGAPVDAGRFFDNMPLRRRGTAEEIARLALFLASNESSYLNGATITADGGITITSQTVLCSDVSNPAAPERGDVPPAVEIQRRLG